MYKSPSVFSKKRMPFSTLVNIRNISLLFLVALISSCAAVKNTYYFSDVMKDSSVKSMVDPNFESKIKKNDLLSIYISSANKFDDDIYNSPMLMISGTDASASESRGYQVDGDGNIVIHKMGKLKAEGLTLKELSLKIKNGLTDYLKDPIILVNFANKRVTVLGEVRGPRIIKLNYEEKISIIDALTAAGDVTELGDKKNIVIIRDSGQVKYFKHINLENASVFNSGWYYLRDNDVMLVSPSVSKQAEQKRIKNQQIITTGLAGVSLLILIIDRLFK